jgi:hypothetical protein
MGRRIGASMRGGEMAWGIRAKGGLLGVVLHGGGVRLVRNDDEAVD